jgi:hypothetical protein
MAFYPNSHRVSDTVYPDRFSKRKSLDRRKEEEGRGKREEGRWRQEEEKCPHSPTGSICAQAFIVLSPLTSLI